MQLSAVSGVESVSVSYYKVQTKVQLPDNCIDYSRAAALGAPSYPAPSLLLTAFASHAYGFTCYCAVGEGGADGDAEAVEGQEIDGGGRDEGRAEAKH